MSSNDVLSENLIEDERGEPKHSASRRSHSAATQQPTDDHDQLGFLSPGFDVSLSDERILGEHVDITLMACCLPCLPMALMKASMENRQCSIVDCILPPNVFQLRQQFRYKYLRTDSNAHTPAPVNEDMAFKDCFLSICCCLFPFAITQMAIEMGQREGVSPSRYASIGN
jgi:hypothetical protein